MLTIGIKELLVIAGIVAFFIWLRMFRLTLDKGTTRFMKKLKGPDDDGQGFGWRGLVVAFVVGIGVSGVIALMGLRLWGYYFSPEIVVP